MCDCEKDELLGYKTKTDKIVINDKVLSIGKKCFSKFEKLQTIEFGKGITKIRVRDFAGKICEFTGKFKHFAGKSIFT